MQGLAVIVKAGLAKSQLDATVGLHPTSAEEFVMMFNPARSYKGGKLHLREED